MTIQRPGIEVQFASSSGSTLTTAAPNTYFTVGYAAWGPINTPTYISTKRDLLTTFGPAVPYGWLVRDTGHFLDTANGSGRAWVVRGFELGVDPQTGALATADAYTAKATLTGASTPALQVNATYPGSLGNTFKVDVIKDALTGVPKVVLWGRSVPTIITWGPDENSVRTQIANNNALAAIGASDFVLEIPGTFVTAGPDVTSTARALFGASPKSVALTGGGDGQTANYPLSALIGGIDSATGKATGLEALADEQYGPGMIAIPGYTPTPTLTEALNLHAQLFKRLGIVTLISSGDAVLRPQDALTLEQTLTPSSFMSYYYPQVYDLDGVLSPAEGYVAGLASNNQTRTDAEGGIKASVTGSIPITGVLQIGDRDAVNDAEADLLYAGKVNYIRNVRGIGYRVESQVLSAPEGAISRLHHRVITLKMWYDITEILAQFRDRNVDASGKLQSDIEYRINEYLNPYQPGKFPPQGNTFYNAATVTASNSIQNSADLEQGLLHVLVEGSLTPKSERISLLFNINSVVIGG